MQRYVYAIQYHIVSNVFEHDIVHADICVGHYAF